MRHAGEQPCHQHEIACCHVLHYASLMYGLVYTCENVHTVCTQVMERLAAYDATQIQQVVWYRKPSLLHLTYISRTASVYMLIQTYNCHWDWR